MMPRGESPAARTSAQKVHLKSSPAQDRITGLLHELAHALRVDAHEAARLGLVNRVVAADALMPWALETAELIAANSPSAVQAVKQQISATIAEHALAREPLEQELGDRVRASAHFREGIAAFREKRRPRYE